LKILILIVGYSENESANSHEYAFILDVLYYHYFITFVISLLHSAFLFLTGFVTYHLVVHDDSQCFIIRSTVKKKIRVINRGVAILFLPNEIPFSVVNEHWTIGYVGRFVIYSRNLSSLLKYPDVVAGLSGTELIKAGDVQVDKRINVKKNFCQQRKYISRNHVLDYFTKIRIGMLAVLSAKDEIVAHHNSYHFYRISNLIQFSNIFRDIECDLDCCGVILN
jgi:hypothetical protein